MSHKQMLAECVEVPMFPWLRWCSTLTMVLLLQLWCMSAAPVLSDNAQPLHKLSALHRTACALWLGVRSHTCPRTPGHKRRSICANSSANHPSTHPIKWFIHSNPAIGSAVYQTGRVGAARQEQWWAAGGRAAMIMAPLMQQRGGTAGYIAPGKRQRTEAAGDKENAQ